MPTAIFIKLGSTTTPEAIHQSRFARNYTLFTICTNPWGRPHIKHLCAIFHFFPLPLIPYSSGFCSCPNPLLPGFLILEHPGCDRVSNCVFIAFDISDSLSTNLLDWAHR